MPELDMYLTLDKSVWYSMPPFSILKHTFVMPKHFRYGITRNIYFTKLNIYFTDKMFILPNIDL